MKKEELNREENITVLLEVTVREGCLMYLEGLAQIYVHIISENEVY